MIEDEVNLASSLPAHVILIWPPVSENNPVVGSEPIVRAGELAVPSDNCIPPIFRLFFKPEVILLNEPHLHGL